MQQKDIVLILARDLAEHLSSAVFLVDHEGTLVYFNEGAAEILGTSFADAGQMRMEEWASGFHPVDLQGNPIEPMRLPLAIALEEREPAHMALRIKGADGMVRAIAVTAIPLFARQEDFVGAAAVFWEDPSGEDGAGP
jgi:PAS domain S-box-containing protein